jgi:hypothetical protein
VVTADGICPCVWDSGSNDDDEDEGFIEYEVKGVETEDDNKLKGNDDKDVGEFFTLCFLAIRCRTERIWSSEHLSIIF